MLVVYELHDKMVVSNGCDDVVVDTVKYYVIDKISRSIVAKFKNRYSADNFITLHLQKAVL